MVPATLLSRDSTVCLFYCWRTKPLVCKISEKKSFHSYLWSKKKKKKSETVDCQCSEEKKRSKTHKRLKACFLIGQNRTKCANFWGSPLFQATYNLKTEMQTINSPYLVSVGWGRLFLLPALILKYRHTLHIFWLNWKIYSLLITSIPLVWTTNTLTWLLVLTSASVYLCLLHCQSLPSLITYIHFKIPECLGATDELFVVLFLDQFGDKALGQGIRECLKRHLYCSAYQVLAAGWCRVVNNAEAKLIGRFLT